MKPIEERNREENENDNDNIGSNNQVDEIMSQIGNLPDSKRIELIENIRNSPSIDDSVKIFKNQLFIEQDWSPEVLESNLKAMIERVKAAKDINEADGIFTKQSFRIRRRWNPYSDNNNSYSGVRKMFGSNVFEEEPAQFGGSKESKLLEYSRKVADNRLKEFLKEEPLPLFTLIEEFENSSNLKVVEKGNEKHIFETFLNYMFEQHFSSEEGKQFYFEAYEILNKKKYFDIAILCFVILENINAIQSSRKDIDTVRMSSTEYNAIFDKFEQNLRKADYDFFTEASKLVPNKTSIKFFEDHIYYHNNTDSFEKTYTINSSLDIDKEHYNFNEELYFINDSTIYLFFIISSYLYMKPNVKLSLEDSINKFSRKMKRTKNKKIKSIGLLLKERKEFNDEELDG